MPKARDCSEASVLAHAADRIRTLTWLTFACYVLAAGLVFLVPTTPAERGNVLVAGAVNVAVIALLTVGVRRGWTVAWVVAILWFAGGLAGSLMVYAATGWWLVLLPVGFYLTGLARLLSRDMFRIFLRRPQRAAAPTAEAWQQPFALVRPVADAPVTPKPQPGFDYFA